MPKIIDYGGRFAFFELAAFTLVRDHGVDALSRHGIARVLATSNSLVRRLLSADADLRNLALREVGVRRRARLGSRPSTPGVDSGMSLLRSLLPTRPEDVAHELVWWRLAVAAPSTATMPADHEHEDGPLHHQFAVATHGFVPGEVLEAAIEAPRAATSPDGVPDPVVLARQERHEDVRARVEEVVRFVAQDGEDADGQDADGQDIDGQDTDGQDADGEGVVADQRAVVLHALVDGLGIAVALGQLTPDEAREAARAHLTGLSLGPRR